jgi:hypothetical protein
MYAIYLRHPRHGTKVAISELEASGDEENGWVRYNPDTLSGEDAAPVVNELEVRRRGRPPKQHHG